MTDDLSDGTAPNCDHCLVPMNLDGEDARPFWRCPECGAVRLA